MQLGKLLNLSLVTIFMIGCVQLANPDQLRSQTPVAVERSDLDIFIVYNCINEKFAAKENWGIDYSISKSQSATFNTTSLYIDGKLTYLADIAPIEKGSVTRVYRQAIWVLAAEDPVLLDIKSCQYPSYKNVNQ